MSLSILPFSLQQPSGYGFPTGSAAAQGTAASSPSSSANTATAATPANPVDVVRISNSFDAGGFTAAGGDTFSLSALFQGQAGKSTAIVGYRVALGGGGGLLRLDNKDVTARTSFTADEFARLTYTTDVQGTQQSLVVVAQSGTRLADGTLIHEIDSPAVRMTVDVTGTRSINAMSALNTIVAGTAANIKSIVQQAGIFTGLVGSTRPTLQTDGNFTAGGGDIYRLSDLFKASAATGQSIVGYRLALGDGNAQLWLDGKDVTTKTRFTADEFAHLTYKADVAGTQQTLLVVAQSGRLLKDGSIFQEIDSPALQITADITGSRSINAMNALATAPSGADIAITSIAQQAGIFTGLVGTTRPDLQTDGNFVAAAGDSYRLSDLFTASAATGKSIVGYRLALGDGNGTLWLGGKDVTKQTKFTADDFAHLTYTTDLAGTQQTLLVVAQSGTLLKDGSIFQEIDSPAVQIMASVTDAAGSRSINALNALSTKPSGADARIASIAQQAGIFTGLVKSSRPTLQTDGNFTAVAGEIYRLSDLFKANAAAGQSIVGYRLALGNGNGQLWLDGKDVTTKTSFTADDFAHLTYTTDVADTQQTLLVVAQSGRLLKDGSIFQEADSPAVQIIANVTNAAGSRSINAMNALSTKPSGADIAIASVVQQAGIFTGLVGSGRPGLQTDGNFTAAAGDTYRLSDLFNASAGKGQSIVGYRLALGEGNGTLWLNGKDVTTKTSFTADDFAHLTYVTDVKDTRQTLLVVAQSGTLRKDGSIFQEIDSPAVQITADVTGSRSINAMNALATAPAKADAVFVGIVQQAGIFTGFVGTGRPGLQTTLPPEPSLSLPVLETMTGAYRSAGSTQAGAATDLAAFYVGAIGAAASPGIFADPGGALAAALLLLDTSATGAFRTAGNVGATSVAIKAYNIAKGL
jgi:ABC-type cobalt transport system substrate-binding protein